MDDEPWESIPWDFDDYLEDSDAPWMEPTFQGGWIWRILGNFSCWDLVGFSSVFLAWKLALCGKAHISASFSGTWDEISEVFIGDVSILLPKKPHVSAPGGIIINGVAHLNRLFSGLQVFLPGGKNVQYLRSLP